MQNIGHGDYLLYFVITYYFIAHDYGIPALVVFLIENAYFALVELPYTYFAYRFFLPFPYQSTFSQRATDCEYMVVQMLKHYLRFLHDTRCGSVFFDGRSFEMMNRVRRMRECSDGLGDTVVSSTGKSSRDTVVSTTSKSLGSWIYSKSRADVKEHDILVLYVHGGMGFGVGSGHMYTEYLSIFLVNLLEQGFANPGILVPHFGRSSSYAGQMTRLLADYAVLTRKASPSCHTVVMADGTGASLALSLLLELHELSPVVEQNIMEQQDSASELLAQYRGLPKPTTAIFISPVTNLHNPEQDHKKAQSDYINATTIRNWGAQYLGSDLLASEVPNNYNPASIKSTEVWKACMPEEGVVISYGLEESLAPEIEKFVNLLRQSGVRLKVDQQVAQIHAWSILSFYTERLIDHREASLQIYSGILSRMLLWKNPAYLNGQSKEPVNIITIDEEYT